MLAHVGTYPCIRFVLGVVISWYRKWTVMWLIGASHLLWLTPESPLGSDCDSPARKGGKYWMNSKYSVGRRMKSEPGYKGTKAQMFQNHSKSFSRHDCDDSLRTHGGGVSPVSRCLSWILSMAITDILRLVFCPKQNCTIKPKTINEV